jgi:hypothetical protein
MCHKNSINPDILMKLHKRGNQDHILLFSDTDCPESHSRVLGCCIFLTAIYVEKNKTLKWRITQKVSVSKFPHALLSWHDRYLANTCFQHTHTPQHLWSYWSPYVSVMVVSYPTDVKSENPHKIIHHTCKSLKINVWCGLLHNKVIGPLSLPRLQ